MVESDVQDGSRRGAVQTVDRKGLVSAFVNLGPGAGAGANSVARRAGAARETRDPLNPGNPLTGYHFCPLIDNDKIMQFGSNRAEHLRRHRMLPGTVVSSFPLSRTTSGHAQLSKLGSSLAVSYHPILGPR